MKHLKKFENSIKFEFDLYDYVKVDSIIKKTKKSIYRIESRYNPSNSFYYIINILDNSDRFWERGKNLRELTNSEKEDLKAYLDSKKYNL